jgi:adenylate kinase family enzyme
MDAGDLVPDDVIIGMMEAELGDADSFMLDGFPRTVAAGRGARRDARAQGPAARPWCSSTPSAIR